MATSSASSGELECVKNIFLQDGTISIGRSSDNDYLVADKTASSYHARIFTYLNASYIEDLDSTNGTYLNGKPVQKHTVHPGDIIRIGRMKFKISKKSESN